MKRKRRLKSLLTAGMLLCCIHGEAQDGYAYTAALDTIAEAGFYRILIPPTIAAKCKEDLSDLRIQDGHGQYTPYVLQSDQHGGDCQAIPAPVITRKDSSNHHSYLTLTFDAPYLVEYLDLDIRGPRLFSRKIHVLMKNDPFVWEWATVTPADHSFEVTSTKARVITLDIDNEDNPPLVIKGVAASQWRRHLLTWLQPGGSYQLLVGNAKAEAPQYDLKYFMDSVKRLPDEIVPGTLQAMQIPAPVKVTPVVVEKGRSGFMLWVIISVVLVLLVFLSLRMLRAIAGDQKKEDKP